MLVLASSATGCPRQTRRTLVPEVPSTGDAQARARFQETKAKFERDDGATAGDFAAIVQAYPDDPIAPFASLYAGIASARQGDHAAAITHLEAAKDGPDAPDGLITRARLFLGISLNYEGKYEDAVPHLRAGEPAIEDGTERGEWRAAMAIALATVAPSESLLQFDGWYADATDIERRYIVDRVTTLVAALSDADAETAFAAARTRNGPVAALLGARVLTVRSTAGTDVTALRGELLAMRKRLGWGRTETSEAPGDASRVGAILPLTGRRARIGELAMRALALAAGTFETAKSPRSYTVMMRDSESDPASSAAAVQELADGGVIGVIGPVDAESVDAVVERAVALGVPLVSMDPRASRQDAPVSPYVVHVIHSAEDRAKALARYAYQLGLRDFAILAPQTGYGRAVGNAFRDEVTRLGAQVVVDAGYAADTTSFGDALKPLRKPFQVVFVPDQAERLELIAPALAAANLVSMPHEARAPRRGRKILLLSTAEALSPKFLRGSGRYTQGAVFAPGFYPDRADALIGDFVDRYEQAFGRAPTSIDAYAYDAAVVLRSVVEGGATTRAQVADQLGLATVDGVTGRIGFDGTGRRGDGGLLYRVGVDDTDAPTVRALRQ